MVFPAVAAAAAAKSLQSYPTLCDPIDGSPLGSSVPGILQARILEWVAISFSNTWKWKVKVKSLSGAWLLATPWTAGYQAPPTMGFSRQQYWSGVPLPSPVVFPTFFNLSLNLEIRSSWSEPQSAPSLVFANSVFDCKEENQSDFGIDHLVMYMCIVISCVVGRGCLLWPVLSLSKTLLAFALLHSVLQGQSFLLLQVCLDSLPLHFNPLWWKTSFLVLVLEGPVGYQRTTKSS